MADFILELSSDPVRFDPFSKLTNIFYDEGNRQLFAVRSGGTTGVVVKSEDKTSISFRMADKGDVLSIKFSPDKKILSVQRSYKSIEFMNFDGEPDTLEYSQSCRGKNMKILGFTWTNVNEIVFVMDRGIEHYQVIPEKHSLKSLKSYNLSINWYIYHEETSLLLLSSGSQCNTIYPFQFRPQASYKLAKFEIDLPAASSKGQKVCLLERDIGVMHVYGQACIFVLRHQPRNAGVHGAEIVIYRVIKDAPPRKSDILRLEKSGRFAINVLDNTIIVHHQASKESVLFDIQLTADTDGYVSYHSPIARCPIKPLLLKVPVISNKCLIEEEVNCELYSPNWVVFLPNVIIDPKLGYLWNVTINKSPLVDIIEDKKLLVDFLFLRQNSKALILKVCHDAVSPGKELKLGILSKIFDKLNLVYKQIIDVPRSDPTNIATAIVDQSDMYSHVFNVFEGEIANPKFAIAVLLEYIRSLMHHQQYVQHFICKLLMNILVKNKKFYQLHQFLQYHILSDSKQLVCLLLSFQAVYPPAYQLALDMLRRLNNSTDQIVEVLLSQNKILQALTFVRSHGSIDSLSAPKYLAAAKQTGDPVIFYSVFKFFEQRNIRLKGSPEFETLENYGVTNFKL